MFKRTTFLFLLLSLLMVTESSFATGWQSHMSISTASIESDDTLILYIDTDQPPENIQSLDLRLTNAANDSGWVPLQQQHVTVKEDYVVHDYGYLYTIEIPYEAYEDYFTEGDFTISIRITNANGVPVDISSTFAPLGGHPPECDPVCLPIY